MNFLGAPYPIVKHPNGFLHTVRGLAAVKSDLLVLLLTNPGERVMLPGFGTPLREYIFNPNDSITADAIRDVISLSIQKWEPRIFVSNIEVTIGNEIDTSSLNPIDNHSEIDSTMMIKIEFSDFDNIQEVQALTLEIPLSGA